jgi:hypothetical protein
MRGAGAAGWVGRTIAGPGKGLRAPVRPRVGLQQCPSDPGFNRRPRLQRAAAVPPAVPRARPPHTLCRLWVVVAMRPAAPGRQPRRAASRDNAGRLSAAQLLCAAGVSGSGGGLSLPGKTPRPHLPVRPWAVAPLNLLQSSRREIFFFYPSAPSSADANTQPPIYRCAYGTWCVCGYSLQILHVFFFQ